jgi:diketogulonate reductase-like aldo/keto reductase
MDTNTTVQLRTDGAMPVLGLGTWQLTDNTAATVREALELGYRLIDTSGDYGTQPAIAEALRSTDVPRDEIYLVTKVEEHEDAYEATRRNLDQLGVERADLLLIHRPPPEGPGEELWEGLLRAREEGLAGDVGVSNYGTDLLDALIRSSGETPAVNQVEWSPFGWSREVLDWCRDHGIVIQAYSPLTRGRRLDDPTLQAIAERHAKTPAQVLLRWDVQMGTVPIPKANRREHLEENLGIFDFRLADGDLQELNGLNEHASSLGSLAYL